MPACPVHTRPTTHITSPPLIPTALPHGARHLFGYVATQLRVQYPRERITVYARLCPRGEQVRVRSPLPIAALPPRAPPHARAPLGELDLSIAFHLQFIAPGTVSLYLFTTMYNLRMYGSAAARDKSEYVAQATIVRFYVLGTCGLPDVEDQWATTSTPHVLFECQVRV